MIKSTRPQRPVLDMIYPSVRFHEFTPYGSGVMTIHSQIQITHKLTQLECSTLIVTHYFNMINVSVKFNGSIPKMDGQMHAWTLITLNGPSNGPSS